MSKLAREDKTVSGLVVKEKFEQAKEVSGMNPAEDENVDWVLRLTRDGNNRIEKTINNVTMILENDPFL